MGGAVNKLSLEEIKEKVILKPWTEIVRVFPESLLRRPIWGFYAFDVKQPKRPFVWNLATRKLDPEWKRHYSFLDYQDAFAIAEEHDVRIGLFVPDDLFALDLDQCIIKQNGTLKGTVRAHEQSILNRLPATVVTVSSSGEGKHALLKVPAGGLPEDNDFTHPELTGGDRGKIGELKKPGTFVAINPVGSNPRALAELVLDQSKVFEIPEAPGWLWNELFVNSRHTQTPSSSHGIRCQPSSSPTRAASEVGLKKRVLNHNLGTTTLFGVDWNANRKGYLTAVFLDKQKPQFTDPSVSARVHWWLREYWQYGLNPTVDESKELGCDVEIHYQRIENLKRRSSGIDERVLKGNQWVEGILKSVIWQLAEAGTIKFIDPEGMQMTPVKERKADTFDYVIDSSLDTTCRSIVMAVVKLADGLPKARLSEPQIANLAGCSIASVSTHKNHLMEGPYVRFDSTAGLWKIDQSFSA